MPQTESQHDDWLIARCQANDKRAFGRLVEKYMERAYYTALGLIGSHEDALDLSQEAFVRAYRSITKFKPGIGGFFTWYYKILRNLCFNFRRDRAKRARAFSKIEARAGQLNEIADANDDPAVIAERDEIKVIVWRAIASLKAYDREIIVLKDFQNLSYKEIAEALNCPIGTVMSRLFSARKQLREKVERYL